jgi:hypothetical protein
VALGFDDFFTFLLKGKPLNTDKVDALVDCPLRITLESADGVNFRSLGIMGAQ